MDPFIHVMPNVTMPKAIIVLVFVVASIMGKGGKKE